MADFELQIIRTISVILYFAARGSSTLQDEMTRADLLFEDAENVSSPFDESELEQISPDSRFGIRQLLPNSVSNWEDLDFTNSKSEEPDHIDRM